MCRSTEPTSRVVLLLALLLAIPAGHGGETFYKYRDRNGNWVYTDQRPEAGTRAEVGRLQAAPEPELIIRSRDTGEGFELIAENRFYVPLELVLAAEDLENLEPAGAEPVARAILPARSGVAVLDLRRVDPASPANFRYRHQYLPGDPEAVPDTGFLYRVPFASATRFRVTQAYPEATTHTDLASRHAVDIAVPVGTGIYAARAGVVFEVTSSHFRGGTDRERDGPRANLVRVVHDDGTLAVYAHLNWDSIRVRPGDRVERGEYIADSGNTGFTTGPHLHFAVQRNAGLRIESLPLRFAGRDGRPVVPRVGEELVAY